MENKKPIRNKEFRCPNCGMPKFQWKRNDGRGVRREDILYCCEGCAEDTGCICRNESVTYDTKGRTPAPVINPD